MWRCTVEIGDLDFQRFHTAFKIIPYRSTKNTELELICWFHTDNTVRTHQEWTKIQTTTCAVWRHKLLVRFYHFFHSLDKTIRWEWLHYKIFRRIMQTLCIQIWTETHNVTILRVIRFQTFKNRLRILEYTSTFVEDNIRLTR